VHCNFLGLFQNKYFFIVVDATTKLFEVFQINSILAEIVIQTFSELIAQFSIPKTITSDGAKCFTGFEFLVYCKNLGIRHITGAPFHPESNGCAESAVKIIKKTSLKNAQLSNPN
jgi:transposase InsO family protein